MNGNVAAARNGSDSCTAWPSLRTFPFEVASSVAIPFCTPQYEHKWLPMRSLLAQEQCSYLLQPLDREQTPTARLRLAKSGFGWDRIAYAA